MAIRNVTKTELNALPVFGKACELAGLPPTLRQLSKWDNHKGLAYTFIHKAKAELRGETNGES